MSKQRYCVYRELTFHCGNGDPDYSTSTEIGYTYAVTPAAAVRNIMYRKKRKPIRESLYGAAVSEQYIAKEA